MDGYEKPSKFCANASNVEFGLRCHSHHGLPIYQRLKGFVRIFTNIELDCLVPFRVDIRIGTTKRCRYSIMALRRFIFFHIFQKIIY